MDKNCLPTYKVNNKNVRYNSIGELRQAHDLEYKQQEIYRQFQRTLNSEKFLKAASKLYTNNISSIGSQTEFNEYLAKVYLSIVSDALGEFKEGINNSFANFVINSASFKNYLESQSVRLNGKNNTQNSKSFINDGLLKAKHAAHDGATWIEYVFSKSIDSSYPGEGYEGTKKQFGTIVTNHGVMVKKDSESVITNAKIINSKNSDVPLLNVRKKMLSLPLGDLKLQFNKKYYDTNYFNDRGVIKHIREVSLLYDEELGNVMFLGVGIKNKAGNWVKDNSYDSFLPVENLYDIWQLLGGEHSIDSKGNFNEGSNEILFDIVVDTKSPVEAETAHWSIQGEIDEREGILKSKMIHIVSNKSILKAGATNLNSADTWTNKEPIMYGTFESRFMGPQLDASHTTDNSQIKEITQIIKRQACFI